jgi:hypothetical protein
VTPLKAIDRFTSLTIIGMTKIMCNNISHTTKGIIITMKHSNTKSMQKALTSMKYILRPTNSVSMRNRCNLHCLQLFTLLFYLNRPNLTYAVQETYNFINCILFCPGGLLLKKTTSGKLIYKPNTTCHSSIEPIREAVSIKLAKYVTKQPSLGMTTLTRETRVKRSLQPESKRERTTIAKSNLITMKP